MKNFDRLFRFALLLVLVAGLVITSWHLSWLHKQSPGYRYEALAAGVGGRNLFVLDRQQGVVYGGDADSDRSITWHVSPLPKP